MKSYKQLKKKLLEDREIRDHYVALAPEFEIARSLIELRIARGLTQAMLAKKVGTKQSAIARIESGWHNPSLSFLRRIASALDSEVHVTLAKSR